MLALGLLAGSASAVQAQAITEGFDNLNNLTPAGWAAQNLSSPIGTTGWFQPPASIFQAFNGHDSSYIAANFNNAAGTGTISNWLFTPARTYRNGDTIYFHTRSTTDNGTRYADRLELRLSTTGNGSNVGNSATTVGDFTTVLVTVNPTLTSTGYPLTWTEYSAVISGLPGPTLGRAAFRYFVTNAGPTGANSLYIGIDNFRYRPLATATCPSATSLSYTGTPFCRSGTANPTLNAGTGGTYASTAGLAINATTGVIDLANSTAGNYTVTYTIAAAGSCTQAQTSANIVIHPTPTVNQVQGGQVCPGTAVNYNFTGTPAGVTFSWTNSEPAIGLAGQGSGNISFTATNNTANTLGGNLLVTPGANGCPGTPTSFDIGVLPRPATPTITIQGSSLQSSSATGNQWFLDGNIINGATGQTFTPTQSGNYTVQVTANSCQSAMSAATNFVLTSVRSLSIENGLQVGPNPVRSELRIRHLANGGRYQVRVLDTRGMEVLPYNRFSSNATVNLGGLPAGTYFIEIRDERNGNRLQRMILKQ